MICPATKKPVQRRHANPVPFGNLGLRSALFVPIGPRRRQLHRSAFASSIDLRRTLFRRPTSSGNVPSKPILHLACEGFPVSAHRLCRVGNLCI